MLGFGRSKEYDVRLTESQVREFAKNMSKQERRDFERKQKTSKVR